MVAAYMGRKNDAKYNICATGVHLREIINGLFFSVFHVNVSRSSICSRLFDDYFPPLISTGYI